MKFAENVKFESNPIVSSVFSILSGETYCAEQRNMKSIIGLPYPLNNVVRHLAFLAMVRVYGYRRVPVEVFLWLIPLRKADIYENKRVEARLRLPLLTDDALARAAEYRWELLAYMSIDTDLLKRLRLKSLPTVYHRNILDSDLKFMKRNRGTIQFVGANPYLTDEKAVEFVKRNRYAVATAMSMAEFCNNTSLSLDCIRELFRIANGDRRMYSDPDEFVHNRVSFRRDVIDRLDYPSDRLTGDDLVQNSTAKQIVSYFKTHRNADQWVAIGRHPNTPDCIYYRILESNRYDVRPRMMFFDRTGPFHLLQANDEFKYICNIRFKIEKLNEQWRHVLDRQLELAKDPKTFFPKTKDEIQQAMDSFKP